MSTLVTETVIIHGRPEQVWAIIHDPAALARVLPGAEALVATGPDAFEAVLASRIQFMTIRADVTATFHDADPPRSLRLELEGRPRGLAGAFRASIPFSLEATVTADGRPATSITYAVDLTTTGRLGAFGAPLMRDTMRRQVAALVANVDRELAT